MRPMFTCGRRPRSLAASYLLWGIRFQRRRLAAIWATAVLMLFWAPRAWAVDPVVGIRSLAMGDSLRGFASGDAGLLLNPSGIAMQRQFYTGGFYSLRPQTLGHFLHTSIADSVTQRYLALGLYNTFFYETPHFSYRLSEGENSNRVITVRGNDIVRTGNEAGLVLAVPLGERFAMGGTIKYGYFSLLSQLHPEDVPPDFTYANPLINGDRKVDLGSVGHVVSFDVGATLRLFNELRLGVVGQNLWAHGTEMPTRLGIGLSYRPSERLLLAADALIDFTGSESCIAVTNGLCTDKEKRTVYRLGGGVEYIVKNVAPLRLGYLYDSNDGAHYISGGVGYLDLMRNYGIDLSLRQQVSAGTETVVLLGVRVQKP